MKTETLKGIVQNINDPGEAGRIKVAIASMDGQIYPEWIEPVFPPGWITMPETGDTVDLVSPEDEDLIEFSEEMRYRGKILDDANPVPKEFRTNYPFRRGYKTKGGHLLIFDDKKGDEEISISHKGNLLIKLTNSGIFFGTGDASEPMVLGNLWVTLMSNLLAALSTHTHTSTAVGTPTSPPLPPELTFFTNSQVSVNNNDQLSNFIFGQKVKP